MNLYNMLLGDCLQIGIWDVWRVPNGWIYTNKVAGTVFVPLDSYLKK